MNLNELIKKKFQGKINKDKFQGPIKVAFHLHHDLCTHCIEMEDWQKHDVMYLSKITRGAKECAREPHSMNLCLSKGALHHFVFSRKGQVTIPKRMNFRKSTKGEGGVIFNPTFYVAVFGLKNRAFTDVFWKILQHDFPKLRAVWNFSKIHPSW